MCKKSVILFGSTDFTYDILKYLLKKKIKINGIVTIKESFKISYSQRNIHNIRFKNIKPLALKNKIPVFYYKNNSKELETFLNSIDTKIILLAGWFHKIQSNIFNNKVCLGFHASLLPQLKGHAPLNWAIINGLKKTGVSLFRITDKIDSGEVFVQKEFKIDKSDHISDLIEKSKRASHKIIDDFFFKFVAKKHKPKKNIYSSSYGLHRNMVDSRIIWNKPSEEIHNIVRASSKPYAGAFTFYNNKIVKIFRTKLIKNLTIFGQPGQLLVLHGKIYVKCSDSVVEILDAEDENGKSLLNFLLKKNNERFK